jgi:DNA-binding transcriptional LysR family regulator
MQQVDLTGVDLNLLVALEALLRERSVTRAARRLHLSQPATSRALGRLRDLLEDPLLVRVGHEMHLTPRAAELVAPLLTALTEVRAFLAAPALFDPTAERTFRLLTSDYAQVVLLGEVLARLEVEAPAVRVIVEPVGPGAHDRLASGEASLLFGSSAESPPWADAMELLADDWSCVRRRGLPLPLTPAEYRAFPHLVVGSGDRFRSPIDAAFARPAAVAVPDFAGALFVVATSDVVATVPRPVAEAAGRLLPIDHAPAPIEVPPVSVAMIWSRRLTADPAHRWLRRTVREAVRSA